MANGTRALIEAAFKKLSTPGTPQHLPTALAQGLPQAALEAPGALELPDSGAVMLFNRPPWGGVSIDLRRQRVAQLHTLTPVRLEHDESNGRVALHVHVGGLKVHGEYLVRAGTLAGSALETAGARLTPQATSDDRVALANNYQTELLGSDNGRFMVGTYHAYNDCYNAALQNGQTFAWTWANATTNGKNTSHFANITYTAAQPQNRGSQPVNSDPDYSPHSFFMQTSLKANLYFLSKNEQDPVQAQRFLQAGMATSTFRGVTVGPSQQNQTVDQVMNTVKTQAPPTEMPKINDADKPAWLDAVDKRALELHERLLRDGIPPPAVTTRRGSFSARVAPFTLSFVGQAQPGAGPRVRFTGVEGDVPPVSVRIEHFPGSLHGDVQAALEKAEFLKGVLARRVAAALGGERVLRFLDGATNQALS